MVHGSGTAAPSTPELSWSNVGLAFGFILFDAGISAYFRLGIGRSLVVAATRCMLQLAFAALLLQKVFEARSTWSVAAITCLLNFLSTFEAVVNKAKRRHDYMFLSTLIGMLCSSIPVSVIGAQYAMAADPFWEPAQYIPIVGMLCGSTVSGIVVSIGYALKEISENRDKVQMYLAFGASRMEASQPIAVEALVLALTPVINQMSVLGLIAISGMMTGAILGGASVQQAAKLQTIIMFMISASTTLGSIFATLSGLSVVIDDEHRIRPDRIESKPHFVWRARSKGIRYIISSAHRVQLRTRAYFAGKYPRSADADGVENRGLAL
ncbi:hypothetical protein HGRIS_004419 [Hohenbuehelia grisea]|uniref:Uncharacterized protein n=1 Tax=Hohenbuehelia grisea TaxID=104357 RepID=A0ABR3JD00_9AGAR